MCNNSLIWRYSIIENDITCILLNRNFVLILKKICVRGMAGKFVDTISIFNRKRNSVKMNISGFAKICHEQIDEIL